MKINPNSGILFTGTNRALLRKIDTDFYTGKFLRREDRSVEHILPRSKGGKNDVFNITVTDKRINTERGNMDLARWFRIHPEYAEGAHQFICKYWDAPIQGVKYGQAILKTITRMGVSI